ncbi:MAG: AAA family ATPase, partial [Tannerella sp.]|nr:AAA family ATPase [Tannerella sp.]
MEQRIIKKLPYGTSNFESLVTEDYYFVDKTRYIELIENEQNKTVFFTRPRKFGKSLFLSMLSYYYDALFAPKFDTLFGNLYIGKHPTKKKNNYLVIKFNFSGLDTSTEEDFKKSF